MRNKYVFVTVMLLSLLLTGSLLTGAYVRYERQGAGERQFRVVTSFYPMYIAALNITGGCSGVSLENLSEPQTGCLHDYQLTAADMKKLSRADVFVVNGGGIESFLSDVGSQYPSLAVVNACERIDLPDDNAHTWMSIPDYMVQVQTIADALAELDAANARQYQDNCGAYLARLRELLQKQRQILPAAAGVNGVILFHEAFAYVAEDLGLTVAGTLDLDEERQVSAGETADVIRLVKEDGVRLILAEELYGKEMCDAIQAETDAEAVYLDTCTRGSYEADSYLKAMEHNLALLEEAFSQ